MPEIKWLFGPNALGYIHSTAQIVALFGAPGTHKSFASIQAILAHQVRCGTNIRVAIVRDTLTNINTSIVPSFYEFFQESPGMVRFKDENRYMIINLSNGHKIEADLFGVNDPADLQRLQGASSWSLIWINDPAPMTEKGNAGVPESAYEHAAYRAMRKSRLPGRLQVDMNYAEETHWTYRRLILEPDIDPESPLIRKEVFHTHYDEVQSRNIEAEQMASRVFRDEAARARYVEGRFAEFKPGRSVTPSYKRSVHLCPYIIAPAAGLDCFAFFDGWHNPSCILGQITQYNRMIFIDTCRLEGADVSTLLENQVGPLLYKPAWKNKWRSWRIGGDFSMNQPDQSNINHKVADDVEKFFENLLKNEGADQNPRFIKVVSPIKFLPKFEPGPSKWTTIEQTINKALLMRDPRNNPMVYLSATNHLLDKGLNGAWHYPVDNSGNVRSMKPQKDEISHVMDGWANAVSVVLGTQAVTISRKAQKEQAAKIKARINSYGPGGGVRSGELWDGDQGRDGRL